MKKGRALKIKINFILKKKVGGRGATPNFYISYTFFKSVTLGT